MIEPLAAVANPHRIIIGLNGAHVVPALIAAFGERAGLRFLEFSPRPSATRTRAAPIAGPWPTS